MVANVIEGNAPTTVTNTTARSVAPNQITAIGSHATNGVICSATTMGRIDSTSELVERHADTE